MKRAISGHSIMVAAREQVYCNLDGEVVILNLKDGVYYGLNAVGARIWNLLQEPRTMHEVRDILAQEYEVETDRCEHDLLALLQELATEGLIEIKDERAG